MFDATGLRRMGHLVGWMALIAVPTTAVWSSPDYILPGSGRTIPVPVIRGAVIGTFKGTFSDCAASRGFTLQLSEDSTEDPQDLGLKGALETFDTSGSTSKSQQISWPVAGRAEGISGVVTLHAVVPAPKKETAPSNNRGGVLGDYLGGLVKKATSGPEYMPFRIGLVRDVSGTGWVGQLFDHKTFGCRGLVMHREDGTASTSLPQLDPRAAFSQADLAPSFVLEEPPFNGPAARGLTPVRQMMGMPPAPGSTPFDGLPWLTLAKEEGYSPAAVALGRIYEYGMGVTEDPRKAFEYYQAAADQNDASAQEALSRLYATGVGTAKDEGQSAQLARLASTSKKAAAALCHSKNILDTTNYLIHEAAAHPGTGTIVDVLGQVFDANKEYHAEDFVILEVQATAVASVNQPFYCKVTAKRIGAEVRDTTPVRQIERHDKFGNPYWERNDDEVKEGEANAALETILANIVPFHEVLYIEPVPPEHYRITLLQPNLGGKLAPKVAREIDSSGAVVGAPATASTNSSSIVQSVAAPALPTATAAPVASQTTSGLTPLSAAQLKSQVSKGGGRATTVNFINHYGADVSLAWVDYSGKVVPYAALAPGKSYVQSTYASHVWLVIDKASGQVIEGFVPVDHAADAMITRDAR